MTLTKIKWTVFFRSNPALNIFFVCLTGLALIFALHTRGRIFRPEWGMYFLAWVIPAFGFWIWKSRDSQDTPPSEIQRGTVVLIFFMVLSFFSSFVLHKWFYFLNWRPQIFPLESTMVLFVVSCLFLSLVLFCKPGLKLTPWLLLLLIGVQLWCFFCLYQRTGGEAIYRDDHPSFIFRLWEFARTFPHTVNYVPYWNAGVVDYCGVTSGIGAIGLPLFPFWKWINIFDFYTYAFGFYFIAVIPLIALFSSRLLGAGWAGSVCAGFLGLGVSRHFFLWLLEYGTVGSLFSSCFILPVSVVLYRIVQFDEMNWKTAGILILSAFFLFQWPPGIILCSLMGISFLASFRQWTFKKWIFLALCAAAILILDAKPLLTIFTRGQETVHYVNASQGTINYWKEFRDGWIYLFAHWQEGHPLLIFLGLGGIFVVPKSFRKWYLPILVGLAFLTGWGSYWRPHLQLGRTSIPLFFVCIAPAAFLIDQLMMMRQKKTAMFRATVIALLVLGGWNVSRLYANRGVEHYVVLPQEIKDLTAWIQSNTASDERILFAGATVHGFGGGHVAALPILTNREMMACDYYHFPPGTIEYNYPPKLFRSSIGKMREFLGLYRVGCVITFRENYKKSFREEMKELFEEKISIGDKTIFKVRQTSPSLFVKGEGTVKAAFNRIQVNLSGDTEEVVIRYHWEDGLKSRLPVELFPYDAAEGIRLIGIRPNGVRSIEIVYDD
jgi:hypothetical protein